MSLFPEKHQIHNIWASENVSQLTCVHVQAIGAFDVGWTVSFATKQLSTLFFFLKHWWALIKTTIFYINID